MKSITVYIVDDSEIFRSGIEHLLMQSNQVGSIVSFPNAHSLVEAFRACPDAICIISSNLPDINLKDVIEKLKQINTDVKTIIISRNATIGNVNLALNMGVRGYITRQASAKELEEAVLTVWNEKQAFSRSVTDTIAGF